MSNLKSLLGKLINTVALLEPSLIGKKRLELGGGRSNSALNHRYFVFQLAFRISVFPSTYGLTHNTAIE